MPNGSLADRGKARRNKPSLIAVFATARDQRAEQGKATREGVARLAAASELSDRPSGRKRGWGEPPTIRRPSGESAPRHGR